MSALTLKTISNSLSKFVKSSNDFTDTLNSVMPQLYALGYWRDLIYELTIDVTGGTFALPQEAESILAVAVGGGRATSAESRWSDYRIDGTGNLIGVQSSIGIVDDGYSPVIRVLDPNFDHQIIVRASRTAVLPSTGAVHVTHIDRQGVKKVSSFTLEGAAEMANNEEEIVKIISIVYEEVPSNVEVVAKKVLVPETLEAQAFGDFVITAPVVFDNTQEVSIGGNTFTLANVQYQLGSEDNIIICGNGTSTMTAEEVAQNIVAYINDEAVPTPTTSHIKNGVYDPQVVASLEGPSTVRITNIASGEVGNSVTTTSVNLTDASWNSGTLSGGADPVDEVSEIVSLSEGRGDSVSRYRKFRIPTEDSSTIQTVDILAKRNFIPLINDMDIEYLGNLAAIKHALLATLAEDNADVDRSEYHWAKCERILEKDTASCRGSIKPKVKVKAIGGVRGGIGNSM